MVLNRIGFYNLRMNTDDKLRDAQKSYRDKDYDSAYIKYLDLANGGHVESQVFIGWMLAEGVGVETDSEAAMKWMQQAADSGSAYAQFYYGRLLTQNGEHERAFDWYKSASEMGDVPSIFRVGYSLIYGKGVAADIYEGCQYLEKARENGHIFALRELGATKYKFSNNALTKIYGITLMAQAILTGILFALIDCHSERLRR